jgi:two-component system, OmpR family, phosphate regulon response regulator PhoB
VKTILVVDDELGSAEVLSLILEEEGYRAFCAVNGQLALIQARDVVPDLVIVDYMMPLMNGAEFARALRADPQFGHTKIILNSGLPEVAIRDHFDGYDAFLRKPFKVETLLELVQRLIGR